MIGNSAISPRISGIWRKSLKDQADSGAAHEAAFPLCVALALTGVVMAFGVESSNAIAPPFNVLKLNKEAEIGKSFFAEAIVIKDGAVSTDFARTVWCHCLFEFDFSKRELCEGKSWAIQ